MAEIPIKMVHALEQRRRAEKRFFTGNSKKKNYSKYKQEVRDYLNEHPEIEGISEIVEKHFIKQLCN